MPQKVDNASNAREVFPQVLFNKRSSKTDDFHIFHSAVEQLQCQELLGFAARPDRIMQSIRKPPIRCSSLHCKLADSVGDEDFRPQADAASLAGQLLLSYMKAYFRLCFADDLLVILCHGQQSTINNHSELERLAPRSSVAAASSRSRVVA